MHSKHVWKFWTSQLGVQTSPVPRQRKFLGRKGRTCLRKSRCILARVEIEMKTKIPQNLPGSVFSHFFLLWEERENSLYLKNITINSLPQTISLFLTKIFSVLLHFSVPAIFQSHCSLIPYFLSLYQASVSYFFLNHFKLFLFTYYLNDLLKGFYFTCLCLKILLISCSFSFRQV